MPATNVLLIVMDTARAQNALPAENPGVMSNVERIAAEGTLFTDAITTAPWTLPSHASLFTGQYTSDHRTHAGTKRFDPDTSPLAERLSAAGYRTVAFSNNSWVSPEFGFDRGFDDFYPGWELLDGGGDLTDAMRNYRKRPDQIRAVLRALTLWNAPATIANALYARYVRKEYDYGARLTNWRIERWLSRRWDRTDPFFMFVNYLEPHLEYGPPRKFRYEYLPEGMSREELDQIEQDAWGYLTGDVAMTDRDFEGLEALYDAELHYLDHRLGRLYEFLSDEKLLDETMIVIVGDHGENVGEHDLMDHQYCLYDTLLRVPLVIRPPGGSERGGCVAAPVEVRDLFPTILNAADAEVPTTESISDNVLSNGGSAQSATDLDRKHAIAEYLTPQPSIESLRERTGASAADVTPYDRGLRCIRTDRWKYIEGTDGHRELFDVASDPWERRDVADENPGVVRDLEAILQAERGSFHAVDGDRPAEMDEAAKRRLEDLGYI
jgi:arylsulfatase A-like enzyme